jgi:hypothetical protein
LICWTLIVSITPVVSADIVRLPNGGEVRGELSESRKSGEPIEVKTLLGGRIVLDVSQAESVSRRPALVEEYVTRSRRIPDTLEAHWELANWCRDNGLTRQRNEQLGHVIAYDPEHAAARRALGHIRHQGEWMSRDDAMKAQGYVKYKGKYVTRQELDLLNKTAAEREAEVEWYPKVRTWFGWATGQNSTRRGKGLESLLSIDSADANPALDEFIGDSDDMSWRLFFVERLRVIAGEKPVPILVRLSLKDAEPRVRKAAFSSIDHEHLDRALPYLVEALEDETNDIVQRAAEALGAIGDTRAVPPLIRALVTSHKVNVQVPSQNTVSISAPHGTSNYSIGGSTGVLPGNIETMLRTGQLPYGVALANPDIRYTTVTVNVDVRNKKVLEALVQLTDGDFGFDQDAWHAYWAAQQSGIGRL